MSKPNANTFEVKYQLENKEDEDIEIIPDEEFNIFWKSIDMIATNQDNKKDRIVKEILRKNRHRKIGVIKFNF